MTVITETHRTVAEVAALVRLYLKNEHPGGTTLDVVETGIKATEHGWRVPVLPNVEPPRAFEYYDTLAGIEIALDEKENLNVILVPVTPD